MLEAKFTHTKINDDQVVVIYDIYDRSMMIMRYETSLYVKEFINSSISLDIILEILKETTINSTNVDMDLYKITGESHDVEWSLKFSKMKGESNVPGIEITLVVSCKEPQNNQTYSFKFLPITEDKKSLLIMPDNYPPYQKKIQNETYFTDDDYVNVDDEMITTIASQEGTHVFTIINEKTNDLHRYMLLVDDRFVVDCVLNKCTKESLDKIKKIFSDEDQENIFQCESVINNFNQVLRAAGYPERLIEHPENLEFDMLIKYLNKNVTKWIFRTYNVKNIESYTECVDKNKYMLNNNAKSLCIKIKESKRSKEKKNIKIYRGTDYVEDFINETNLLMTVGKYAIYDCDDFIMARKD